MAPSVAFADDSECNALTSLVQAVSSNPPGRRQRALKRGQSLRLQTTRHPSVTGTIEMVHIQGLRLLSRRRRREPESVRHIAPVERGKKADHGLVMDGVVQDERQLSC